MRVVIEKAPLIRALGHLQGVVERRTTIPILDNVLMKAGGGGLSLAATDMDIQLVEEIAARVETDGTTTVPVRTLYDIARKLGDGSQIELELTKSALAVRSGRSRFSLPTIQADDFPAMAADDLPHRFKMPASDLAALIDQTQFAISTEETRYYLNGIYLHPSNGCLRSVSTNGHQLARADVDLPEGAEGMAGVIVPRKTVRELRKLLDGDGEVSVSAGPNRVRFALPKAAMASKVIDGTFPDYDRVIPTGNDKVIEVAREEFTAAIDRVATIDVGHTRAVKLTFGEGSLVVSAENSQTGSATEEMEARYSGEEMAVGFNSRYLLDIAGQIMGDSLRFELANSGGPALLRDAAGERAIFVIMPMRV